jgi:signal peptidase I
MLSNATLERPRLQRRGFIREFAETVLLIVAIYALVNMATARFIVEGPSMQPNFDTGQFLIVSRLSYLLGEPDYGDIIVFHYFNNPEDDYIKRVIGLPGDTVKMQNLAVYVNGNLIQEPYINEPCSDSRCRDNEWVLGEDEFFVMGDNRNHSSDSRAFGPITREYIVGEAVFRYWPPAQIGLVTKIHFPQG